MLNYEHCTLCPRKCGVNRTIGELGFCNMPAYPKLARAMLHFGEEPPITGENGAGAVFFSGCTLRCNYCQNAEISLDGFGIRPQSLRATMEALIEQGAECIDLVTPTQFLPDIIPALTPKLPVPVVYNCGGYESVDTLRKLQGLIDIYMPDLKYSDDNLAAQLSKAPNYYSVATRAILEMYRQTGPLKFDNGKLKKGVLLRHLVLPGHVDNSLGVLDWVSAQFPKGEILFSLMSQYIPMRNLEPPFHRTLTEEEYAAVESWMELCGIREGFTQEFSSATDEYLPTFGLEGIK